MKTKLLPTMFVLIIFLLLISSTTSTTAQGSLATKVIVIDPGHGGIYSGAVHYGIREAEVNLEVALKLRDRLAASGATVLLTRTCDVNPASPSVSLTEDLKARVDFAKNADADIFISLHANADTDANVNGVISFYPTGHADDLARAIQGPLVKQTGAFDAGVRPANFYVLRNSDVPAALIEMGFLTNEAECSRLKNNAYQSTLADGLAAGILAYFQSHDAKTPISPTTYN